MSAHSANAALLFLLTSLFSCHPFHQLSVASHFNTFPAFKSSQELT